MSIIQDFFYHLHKEQQYFETFSKSKRSYLKSDIQPLREGGHFRHFRTQNSLTQKKRRIFNIFRKNKKKSTFYQNILPDFLLSRRKPVGFLRKVIIFFKFLQRK